MSRPFDFGRVFFPCRQGQTIPDEILFQPLGNHAANVRKLVWHWDKKNFIEYGDMEASRKRVADAAYLHDIGKPQKFGISVNVKAKQKAEFIYSFRGHRFLANAPKQPWVEFLAKGHHDYSAHDICRDTYKLKALITNLESDHPLRAEAEKYRQILELEPLAYAHELYILEMCDQIEAEIACRFFEDKEQAESRAFMDFTITKDDIENAFYVDPWIFSDDRLDFTLTLASWSMPFPQDLKEAIEKESKDNAALTKQLKQAVESWWKEQSKDFRAKTEKVIIRRLSKDKLERLKTNELYAAVGNFSPNLMQEDLAEQLDREKNPHPAILLKAPTGSGKTESILFPALANDYRLFLILPARSLLEDQKKRIDKYLIEFSKLPQNQDREISLVVDTGAQMDRWIYKNGKCDKPKVNPRRHLYKGHVILTTLDKFLYRYFSFGDKQKSFIFPHRIHRQDSLFCFDEAHSYDEISFTNFQSLVQSLYEAGRSLVLMTATMPPELAKRFDYLQTIDYATKLYQQPERSFEWNDQLICDREKPGDYRSPDKFQKDFAEIIFNEWQTRNKCTRIIAVVETVRDAAAIYQELKSQLRCETSSENRWLFLYHGRIADKLRPELYRQIKQRDDAGQPHILVTTSAIEVGCDLNAEVLISQICPPENLIQRAGRCNRKGDVKDAKVIVVGARIPDFTNTLDDSGWQKYQGTLQSLITFDVHAIGECISRSQHIDDYRVVELFSMLHDYVYGADLTCQPIYKRGLIPTRSWTPSVNLEFLGKDTHCISVPIDRLCKGERFAGISVYELNYDPETTRYTDKPLGWGEAYGKQITVKICPEADGVIFEASLPQYPYNEEFGFVELPQVFSGNWAEGSEIKLKYEDGKHKAIVSYVKSLDS